MKIQRLETYTRENLSIVKVCTDDGAEGFGQISPLNAGISAMVFHRQVAPHALGKDPMQRDRPPIASLGQHTSSPVATCAARCAASIPPSGISTVAWRARASPSSWAPSPESS